jgi:hypothetical protein
MLTFITVKGAHAQKYADVSYYLIDSLEIDKLGDDDKVLLDSFLTIYHANDQDGGY